MKFVIASCLVTVLPFAIAQADRDRPHRKPPQEAFAACSSAKQGDRCTVTLRDHSITGTCEQFPDTTALACRPDHPPPPPEAVEACKSAREGDSCSVTHDGHSLSGTCAKGPDASGPLACRPAGPPPERR